MVACTREPQSAQSQGLVPSPSFKGRQGLGERGRTSPAPAQPVQPAEQWLPLTGGAARGARGDVTRAGARGGARTALLRLVSKGNREAGGDLKLGFGSRKVDTSELHPNGVPLERSGFLP